MRFVLILATLGACGGGSTKAPAAPVKPVELTVKDIVQASEKATVRIEASGPRGEQVGTGFILDAKGIVATNLHVILGTSDIKIKLADGTTHQAIQVENMDPLRDLALVRFAATGPLATLRLGDSSKVVKGDPIIAIGNPLGVFENTVSQGIVSAVRTLCSEADARDQTSKCLGEFTLLQISAPISQGSSGGPLFNSFGEVIGITTAINTEGQLINFAVPTNYLKPLIASPAPIPVGVFAEKTRELAGGDGSGRAGDDAPINRAVPEHELAVLEGCNGGNLAEVSAAIAEAIKLGAPLYNEGNHEACFRIYENTVTKYERDGACKGMRRAFGDGLVRASAMPSFKEKAWVLRDTFDGMLLVTEKWTRKHGPLPDARAPRTIKATQP